MNGKPSGDCVRAVKVAQMKWRACVSRESGSNKMNILTPQNVRLWRIPPFRDYERFRVRMLLGTECLCSLTTLD